MTTKEWLNRGRNLDKEINALDRVLTDARARCTSKTSTLKVDVVSTDKDPHAAMDRLAEVILMVDSKIDALWGIKQEILRSVNAVEDITYRTLLIERYINMKTWEQIAADMNYSYKHVVMGLHPKALREIEKEVIEGNIA